MFNFIRIDTFIESNLKYGIYFFTHTQLSQLKKLIASSFKI